MRFTVCFTFAALCLACLLPSPLAAQSIDGPLTVEDCVSIALKQNAQIAEAEAKLREYEALLSEVEAVYYPKLEAMALLAPMFTIEGDINGYERKWKSISDWGPYTSLQAQLVQIIYTFERAEHGAEAASHYALVHAAQVREAELAVALEVRKMAFLHLYAKSLFPTLDSGAEIIAEAQKQAQEMYDSASGEVTMADIAKLDYFAATLQALQLEAEMGAELSLEALKHTMGLGADDEIELTLERLPRSIDPIEQDLDHWLSLAAQERPEWQQLEHGRKAAEELKSAEALAMAPVLFAAGQFKASWTPTRDDLDNPYVNDSYNDLFGGVALGILWDFDPATALAKADKAQAMVDQVDALNAFAETGIPLRVRQAYLDLKRLEKTVEINRDAKKAARKWMLFSATAFGSGLGDAKELLEGTAAYLQANAAWYEALKDYFIAKANLDFAVGSLPAPQEHGKQ